MKFTEKIEQFLEKGEDYPRGSVPKEDRRPWWSIGFIYVGVYICVASILEGLALIGGLPFYQAVLAQIVGFLIFLTLMFVQGNIGTETGLTTYVLARESFGIKGSNIISIISFLGSLGWYTIHCRTTGESLATIFGWSNIPLISVLSGLLMMLTAILGYRALAAISVPTVIYTFGVMLFLAIFGFTQANIAFNELILRAPISEPMTFAAAVSVVVGGMAIAGVIAPDVMRFSRSTKDNFKAIYLLVLPLAIIQPIASMIVGLLVNSTDVIYVLMKLGGIFGLILVVSGAWTSNDNNLYSASLAISEIMKRGKRWKMTIIIGVLASIVSAIVDLSMYINIMFIIGAFSVPILGVTVTDYYILPKIGLGRGLSLQAKENLNPAAIIAWAIGGVIQALIDFAFIPNPLNIPSAIITIILTSFIYIIIMKMRFKQGNAIHEGIK